MKKTLLLTAAVVALMASSCSSDSKVDEPAPAKNAIGFTAFTSKTSRGTGTDNETTTTNLKGIKLYGYDATLSANIIPGVAATVSNGSSLTYSPTAYWFPKTNYKFLAVAGSQDGGTGITYPTTEGWWTNDAYAAFKVNNTTGTNDIVVATTQVTTGENTATSCPTPVSLKFNHIMTRIQFAYSCEGGEVNGTTMAALNKAYTVKVSNVKFTAPAQNQDFTPVCTASKAIGSWASPKQELDATVTTGVAAGTEFTIGGWSADKATATAIELTARTGYANAYYFVPFTKGKLTFDAVIGATDANGAFTPNNGTNHSFSLDVDGSQLDSREWGMGYSYLLTLYLNEANLGNTCPIAFSVEVETYKDYDFGKGDFTTDNTNSPTTDTTVNGGNQPMAN